MSWCCRCICSADKSGIFDSTNSWISRDDLDVDAEELPLRPPQIDGFPSYSTDRDQPLRGSPIREAKMWCVLPDRVEPVVFSLYANGFSFTHDSGTEVTISLSPFCLVRACRLQGDYPDGDLSALKIFKISFFLQDVTLYFGVSGSDAAGDSKSQEAGEEDKSKRADEERACWVLDIAKAVRVITQSLFRPFAISCEPLPSVGATQRRLMAGYLLHHEGLTTASVLYCELHAHRQGQAKLALYENELCAVPVMDIHLGQHSGSFERVGVDCSCFCIEDHHFSARTLLERRLWLRAISNVKVKLRHEAPSPSREELAHYRSAIREHIAELGAPLEGQAPRDPLLRRCPRKRGPGVAVCYSGGNDGGAAIQSGKVNGCHRPDGTDGGDPRGANGNAGGSSSGALQLQAGGPGRAALAFSGNGALDSSGGHVDHEVGEPDIDEDTSDTGAREWVGRDDDDEPSRPVAFGNMAIPDEASLAPSLHKAGPRGVNTWKRAYSRGPGPRPRTGVENPSASSRDNFPPVVSLGAASSSSDRPGEASALGSSGGSCASNAWPAQGAAPGAGTATAAFAFLPKRSSARAGTDGPMSGGGEAHVLLAVGIHGQPSGNRKNLDSALRLEQWCHRCGTRDVSMVALDLADPATSIRRLRDAARSLADRCRTADVCLLHLEGLESLCSASSSSESSSALGPLPPRSAAICLADSPRVAAALLGLHDAGDQPPPSAEVDHPMTVCFSIFSGSSDAGASASSSGLSSTGGSTASPLCSVAFLRAADALGLADASAGISCADFFVELAEQARDLAAARGVPSPAFELSAWPLSSKRGGGGEGGGARSSVQHAVHHVWWPVSAAARNGFRMGLPGSQACDHKAVLPGDCCNIGRRAGGVTLTPATSLAEAEMQADFETDAEAHYMAELLEGTVQDGVDAPLAVVPNGDFLGRGYGGNDGGDTANGARGDAPSREPCVQRHNAINIAEAAPGEPRHAQEGHDGIGDFRGLVSFFSGSSLKPPPRQPRQPRQQLRQSGGTRAPGAGGTPGGDSPS